MNILYPRHKVYTLALGEGGTVPSCGVSIELQSTCVRLRTINPNGSPGGTWLDVPLAEALDAGRELIRLASEVLFLDRVCLSIMSDTGTTAADITHVQYKVWEPEEGYRPLICSCLEAVPAPFRMAMVVKLRDGGLVTHPHQITHSRTIDRLRSPSERCGTCDACGLVEVSKTLLAPNPPFTHATESTVLTWNRCLWDNPCEHWVNDYAHRLWKSSVRKGLSGEAQEDD